MYLDEKNLLPAHKVCTVCNSTKKENTQALRIQLNPDVFMQHCNHCLAVSATRMPKDSYLEELYESNFQQRIGHVSDSEFLLNQLAKKIANNFTIFMEKQTNNKRSLNLLDFGGNNGALAFKLKELLKTRFPATSINAVVVDHKNKLEFPDINFVSIQDFYLNNFEFNMIIASAVFEHIPNLYPVLQRLFEVSATNCFFYARTPYEVPLAKYIPSYSVEWPFHVHDFGPDFWQRFEVIFPRFQILKSNTCDVSSKINEGIIRYTASHVLKMPSLIETSIFKKFINYKGYIWRFVGGWEVFAVISK